MSLLLVEPAIIQDVYASGLAEAEDLGDGSFRFTFYVKQKSFLVRTEIVEHVIVSRLILPVPAVMLSIQTTMKAMGFACCGGERMKLRH